MSDKTSGCVLDTALLLEFYRHSTGADYLPESATLVGAAVKACDFVAAEFVIGLSRFSEVLQGFPDLAGKIRLLDRSEADALVSRLSDQQEAELSEIVRRVGADSKLRAVRALGSKRYVRSIEDETGYILRLALLAGGLGSASVFLMEDRFELVEALARTQARGERRSWVGQLECVEVSIAGSTVTFVTLPSRSLGGIERGYSLVMRGGGMKGLAYAGALQELERFFTFDKFVGTSAGAIAASLLGAGWSPKELEEELAHLQLRQMVSLNPLRMLLNLVFRGGLFDGGELEKWIEGALRRRLSLNRTVTFKDLSFEVLIAVSTSRRGAVVFGRKTHPEASVAYAARCSSGIPLFFVPGNWEGEMAVDGGVEHNLPVRPYFESGGDERVLILTLESEAKRSRPLGGLHIPIIKLAKSLLRIWLGQDEEPLTRLHSASVITIDTGVVSATQLTVTPGERAFLVTSGRLAALRFLEKERPHLMERRHELEKMLETGILGT